MKPGAVLGFDPAPGDAVAVDRTCDVLHKVIRALVESRSALDALTPAGSIWDGAVGAALAALVRRYSLQLRELEDALLGCLTSLEGWRLGLHERQERVRSIVDAVADLAGEPAEDRRAALLVGAREIETEHRRAARDVQAAFEELSTTVERLSRTDDDLAEQVDAAVRALAQAVEDWVQREGPELIRTAAALAEVAALTTVISELVGVAALDGSPGEDDCVREIISRSPGAHRLIRALRQQWLDVVPELPAATFGPDRTGELADSIAGRLAGDEPVR